MDIGSSILDVEPASFRGAFGNPTTRFGATNSGDRSAFRLPLAQIGHPVGSLDGRFRGISVKSRTSASVASDPTARSAVPWREDLERLRFGAAELKSETLSTPAN
jgi:hypothetical protein